MDLAKLLKQLKTIEADRDYTEKSRRLILASPRPANFGFWQIVLKHLAATVSLTLTGILIFLILGGFSAWKTFSPLRVSSLDQAGLKAEAQAIDIQIQLTNLDYNEPLTGLQSSESTPSRATPGATTKKQTNKKVRPVNKTEIQVNNVLLSPNDLSIDEALDKLSE